MQKKRFDGLNHLRATAILMVLVYHYRAFGHPEWVDQYGRFGWTGVDLFFVLSGFLITQQLVTEIKLYNTLNIKAFFVKRFFRIIPPYVIILMLYFFYPFFRERESLPPLWKFLTFTQNSELDVISEGTFSHAWSLCIEEQFYILLPFLLLLLIKTNTLKYIVGISGFAIFCSILFRYVSWERLITSFADSDSFIKFWYMNIYYPTYNRLDGLAVGVSFGYLFVYSKAFKQFIDSKGNTLFLLSLLFIAFSFWFCTNQISASASVIGFTLVALSYGLLVLAAISKSSFLNQNRSRITSLIAKYSYSIYLSHKGIIHIVQNYTGFQSTYLSGNFVFLLCISFCLVGGFVMHSLIEKPISIFKANLLVKQ